MSEQLRETKPFQIVINEGNSTEVHTVIPGSESFPYWTFKWDTKDGPKCKFVHFNEVKTLEIKEDYDV